MAYAMQTQIRLLLIRVYTVCHSTKYLKKQLHKKQNIGQKGMEKKVSVENLKSKFILNCQNLKQEAVEHSCVI